MSYDVIESSAYSGKPVEFYEFSRGSKFWRFTSGEVAVNFLGATYNPIPIKRSSVVESQDVGKAPITLDTSRANDFVQEYIAQPPNAVVNLTIRRYHSSDPDLIASDSPTANDVIVIWMGRVVNVSFKGDMAKIRCESIHTSLKRSALRRSYQTSCTHTLYGSSCLVDRSSFVDVVQVDAINGASIQANEYALQADGYYTGGFVEVVIDGSIDRRQILSHTTNTIVLSSEIQGLVVGIVLDTFPGCDRSLDTCVNKFSNVENYGGFPYIPVKNPFGGQSVF